MIDLNIWLARMPGCLPIWLAIKWLAGYVGGCFGGRLARRLASYIMWSGWLCGWLAIMLGSFVAD